MQPATPLLGLLYMCTELN